MISRLSAYAALFAVIATASLAFATSAASHPATAAAHAAAQAAKPVRVVQLEPVLIVGKRSDLIAH